MTTQEWDRMKQGISAAGDPIGKELIKVMEGDYDSAEDAAQAVALATLKGINDGIVKNIPWVGGLFHGMLTQILNSNEQIRDKMDDVMDHIDSVTSEVQGLRNDVKVADEQTGLSSKINKASNNLLTMKELYRQHNAQFLKVMEDAASGDEMTDADIDELDKLLSNSNKLFNIKYKFSHFS